MPTDANFEKPPIRMKINNSWVNEELEEHLILETVTMVEAFDENRYDAFRGQLPEWVLVGVKVDKFGVKFLYGNHSEQDYELLRIMPITECEIALEIDCGNGDFEKYLLKICQPTHCETCAVTVIEFHNDFEREIVFGRETNGGEEYLNSHSYVYVTEYFRTT